MLSEGQLRPPSLICKSVRVSLHKETTPIPLTIHFPGCLYLLHQLSNKESCWLFTPKVLLLPGAWWRFINPTQAQPVLTSPPLRWQLNHAEQQPTWVRPLAIGQWLPHCWQVDVTLVMSDLLNLITKNRAKKLKTKRQIATRFRVEVCKCFLGISACLFPFFSSLPLQGPPKLRFIFGKGVWLWQVHLSLMPHQARLH